MLDRREVLSKESGFTLIELLIVIGIIVALAAAVVPNLVGQADEGDIGARAVESEIVQSAMDVMIADIGITAVTEQANPSNSTNLFTTVPTEGPLTSYLRNATTSYYYCWDTTGKLTQQDATAATCP